MKICNRCKIKKKIEEFPPRGKSIGPYCRPCKREYDREYWAKTSETRRASIRVKKFKLRIRNRSKIFEYLKVHPCVDCGEADPIILEFDHRSDKIDNISTMLISCWSWKSIEAEVKKCDVRCANCHRRKTAKEQNWYAHMN